MFKRILALVLCAALFVCLLPAAALAEEAEDYVVVTVKKGDTVKKLLEANGRTYATDKYIVMVLNGFTREKQMELLSIGQTLKIPKHPADIEGSAPHLISSKDKIEYYVIPYSFQKGDTLKFIYKLWGLSYDDYKDAVEALNPDKNLSALKAGSIVYLPTTEKNLHTNVFTTVMAHVMLQDETVESVISRYGYDYEADREDLQRYNVTSFNKLEAGDKLLIPLH